MQGNFQTMDTSMDVNHYTFSNATADNGKHRFAEFVAGIKPVLTGTDIGLFTKLVSYIVQLDTGLTETIQTPEMFFETTAGVEHQISGRVVASETGECPLFGGLGLKWGSFLFPNQNRTVNITYIDTSIEDKNLRLRNFTETYAVIAVNKSPIITTPSIDNILFVANQLSSGFTLQRDVKPVGINPLALMIPNLTGKWIAIGKV
jgi:hypothetical protein